MLLYSEIGGLKAIMNADAIQALILLTVTWIIGISCVLHYGDIRSLFQELASVNEALLSVPGPNGLFTPQFLIASFLVILCLPITQPQLTIRLVIIRNLRTTHLMAVAVGIFAMLIIFPTIFIGLYGAVRHADLSTADFLSQVLLYEQPDFIAAVAVVGLLAAGLSTSDSMIFALGTELRSVLPDRYRQNLNIPKVAIVVFAAIAVVFSLLAGDQLAILARVSFAGTSMLAPLILSAVLSEKKPHPLIIVSTAAALVIFLASLLGVIPNHVGPIRMDLFLLVANGVVAALTFVFRRE